MPLAKQDPLAQFKEGVFKKGMFGADAAPIPLKSTVIDVAIRSGFSTVKATRIFTNAEDQSIEAVLTFPVPVDCVVHGLEVEIDGRRLIGVAKAASKAREMYEAAIDEGKAAVMHEEKLKGIHMLSIANIAPGKDVRVEMSWSMPLSFIDSATPNLRIPMTVAEVYGRSPLLPSDDLVVDETKFFEADLTVSVDSGMAHLRGDILRHGAPTQIKLDRPVIISVTGAIMKPLFGRAADGRRVELTVSPLGSGNAALSAAILFDRSGSMNSAVMVDGRRVTSWAVAREALQVALVAMARWNDRISLWHFDDQAERIGLAEGEACVELVKKIGEPRGGTEIGRAVALALDDFAQDVVVVTDGRSYALDVQKLAARGKRISAVLVGENALEAQIGHLAALTGGMIVVAGLDSVLPAMIAVLNSLRNGRPDKSETGLTAIPAHLVDRRAGAALEVAYGDVGEGSVDAVGAYTAWLALARLSQDAAANVASAHGLCTHLTSLVVVDGAGDAQIGLPNQRKTPLSAPVEINRGGGGRSSALIMDEVHFLERPVPPPPFRMLASDDSRMYLRSGNASPPAFIKFVGEFSSGERCWEDFGPRMFRMTPVEISQSLPLRVSDLAFMPDISVLAASIGQPPILVVVALAAKMAGDQDRHAARVARRVLANVASDLVDKALLEIGVTARGNAE